jgi:uncharacterized membrane protein YcaP (DUF421 family)
MDNYTFDLQRIFFGDFPPVYLFEIAFRTTFLFLYTVLMLRFVGRRGTGQLSLFEFIIVIALGTAVGDPMFYPHVPLLHGMAVITLTIFFQRIIVRLTSRHPLVENFIEGKAHRLILDGMIDLAGVKAAVLSREEVYMELRQNGIQQLGEVRRAYLEIDGQVSVFRYAPEDVKPGLALLPHPDMVNFEIHDTTLPRTSTYACYNCGRTEFLEKNSRTPPCPRCKDTRWIRASMDCVPE